MKIKLGNKEYTRNKDAQDNNDIKEGQYCVNDNGVYLHACGNPLQIIGPYCFTDDNGDFINYPDVAAIIKDVFDKAEENQKITLEYERKIHNLNVKIKELEAQIEEQACDEFDDTEETMQLDDTEETMQLDDTEETMQLDDIAEKTLADFPDEQLHKALTEEKIGTQYPQEQTKSLHGHPQTYEEALGRISFFQQENMRLLAENGNTHNENMFLRQTIHTMNILGGR